MNKRHILKITSCILVIALLLGFSTPVMAQSSGNISWVEIDNDQAGVSLPLQTAAESVEEVFEYHSSDIVRVSIVLDNESTLDAGFSAEEIAANDTKAIEYREALKEDQVDLEKAISKNALDGEPLNVIWNLSLFENAISAFVPYESIERIKDVNGVSDVVIETRYEICEDVMSDAGLNMATSSSMIGSSAAWANGYTGAGTRIAIIDTGLDTDHQSFSSEAFEYSLSKNAEHLGQSYDEYIASLNLLTNEEVEAKWEQLNISKNYNVASAGRFYSSKVPFGANYIDKTLDITHDHDSQGEHGSHVAGIAAANSYIPDGDGYKAALEAVKTQGVAPDAQLLIMKVFGKNGGAYDSDYFSAIEDAIVLGANTINLSLGSANAGPSKAPEELLQKIMDSLSDSNTVVVCSQGNSGSWAENTVAGYLYSDGVNFDTAGSPGSFTNSFTVASVDNDGATGDYMKLGDEIIFYIPANGANLPPLSSLARTQEYEYIYIDSVGLEEEFKALKDLVEGKIAICNRGVTPFVEKITAAKAAGAIACVIVNNAPGSITMTVEGYTGDPYPCVSVAQSVGELFKAAGSYNKDRNYYLGSIEVANSIVSTSYNSDYYNMSDFSSMGISGSLQLKPDVSAPGGNIYSVNGLISGGQSYESMSGTSMAAPQIAGMGALISQYIRDNNLEALTGLTTRQLTQSLLMSTAVPLTDEEGQYYSVLKQGSGLANVDKIIHTGSYILMDDKATTSAGDGKVKAELGDDPNRTGKYSFSFTLNNLTNKDKTFTLSSAFFTQDHFTKEGVTYLDTETAPLSSVVKWYANGQEIKVAQSSAIKNCDFDGDSFITESDGQALLDYITGSRKNISNKNKADLDQDGDIDTHDAYCFFQNLGTSVVKVPANGKVKISVFTKLTNIDDYDDCGAYVEGFVFANEFATDEGVAGDCHSIPVLAYYGGWDESSMFDVGSRIEYSHKLESRDPYMYVAQDVKAYNNNSFIVHHADDGGLYYMGGNPYVKDDEYLPERNAFNNSNGNVIELVSVSTVRNAAASNFTVSNDDEEILLAKDFGALDCAFYNDSNSSWTNVNENISLNYKAEGLNEGDRFNLKYSLAPEYYVNSDGSVNWESLNSACNLELSLFIDNTKPRISTITSYIDGLLIEALDNRYIAAVAIYNDAGEMLALGGSNIDAELGEKQNYFFPMETQSGRYLIQVYDYASNYSSYKVNLNPDELKGEVAVTLDRSTLDLLPNNQYQLKATVGPWGISDESVTWTSSDEKVAIVDSQGIVKSLAVGSVDIIATANAAPTKSATCKLTVSTLPVTVNGILYDEEAIPKVFSWNVQTENVCSITNAIETSSSIVSFTSNKENSKAYLVDADGYAHVVDKSSWTITSSSLKPLPALLSDMAMPENNGGTEANYVLGIYGPYLFAFSDLMSGTYVYWDLSYHLAINGANRFTAMARSGESEKEDIFNLLDNRGNLWTIWYDGSDSISLSIDSTDLMLEWPRYNDLQLCSMIKGEDGNLYLSYYTGKASDLYVIFYDTAIESYRSMLIDSFGSGVWPCMLDSVTKNNAKKLLTTSNARTHQMEGTNGREEIIVQMEEGLLEDVKSPQINGSINSVESSSSNRYDGVNYCTVYVTASDILGKEIKSNNGLVKFNYNSNSLELKNIKVFADYSAINKNTLAYVDLKGMPNNRPLAQLSFQILNNTDTSVQIETLELNNEKLNEVETVTLKQSGTSTTTKEEEKPASNIFVDVNDGDYFKDAVLWAFENKISFGVDSNHFAPLDATNRAQMLTFLWRAAGSPEPSKLTCPFTDVVKDSYYFKAVLWAYEKRITSGTSSTTFSPSVTVNRAQAVTFLARMSGIKDDAIGLSHNLIDVKKNSYYYNAVAWAVANDITKGTSSVTFSPDEVCQRGQIVTFLYRYFAK